MKELTKDALLNGEVVTIEAYMQVVDRVAALESDNEELYGQLCNARAYIDKHEEIWKRNAEIDKAIVRKETAKEILQTLYDEANMGYDYPDEPHSLICTFDAYIFDRIADKYGVELK